jgi:4-amino-4-deoxy-L-arabinose transferase-like glycosyltransferase
MTLLPRAHPHLASVTLFLALSLPFAGGAFRIDDPAFIATARQIEVDPLHPYSFDIAWAGSEADAFTVFAHPPGVPLLIAGVRSVCGEGEVPLHLFFYLFAAGAVVLCGLLARELGQEPLTAELTLVASAPFLVCAQTVMPEMPLLFFFLGAIVVFVRGLRRDRELLLVTGALIGGLPALCRYSGMLIVPILSLAALLWSTRRRALFWPLLSFWGVLVWAGWSFAAYGKVHLPSPGALAVPDATAIAVKLAIILIHLGGALLFPLLVAARGWPLLGAAGGVVGLFLALRFSYPVLPAALVMLFLAAATAWLGMGLEGLQERGRKQAFLFLWSASVLLFHLAPATTASRHLILALPAIALMLGSLRAQPLWPVLANLAMSFLLVVADGEAADAYRELAATIAQSSDAGRIRFTGHWGIRYYLERVGAKPLLASGPALATGDLILAPVYPWSQKAPLPRDRLVVEEEWSFPLALPLRTISREGRACFHASHLPGSAKPVLLPFSLATGPVDRITLYRVGEGFGVGDAILQR